MSLRGKHGSSEQYKEGFKKQKKTNEMSSLCQIRQSEKNILKKKINIKKQKTSLASIRGEMLVDFWFLEQHNNLFNL